jgi:AcrR family transcriptional regulator
MPKLKEQAVERNQIRIEDAALGVFTRQGYHGTSVREIADAAGVSLGNIYNYYDSKEQIYTSLVRRYGLKVKALQEEKIAPLVGSLEPENLTRLALVMREIVAENSDFWRLMYIDVVEFGNQHFSHIFQAVPATLRAMNPGAYDKAHPGKGDEVEFAYAAVYMQFVTYFLIETLFGGKQHFGISDEEAIARLIGLATAGLEKSSGKATNVKTGGTYASKHHKDPVVRRRAGTGRHP